MTPAGFELLVDGAEPTSWQPWVACGSLLVSIAAALFLFRAVARRAARYRGALPLSIRRGVPLAFAAVCLVCYWPLWRFVVLRVDGEVESSSVISGRERVRFPSKPRYRKVLCEVEVRTSQGETWSAFLEREACARLRREVLTTPFVVARSTRLIRQSGLYPSFYQGWLSIAFLAALTLSLIAVATARNEAGRPRPFRELRFRLKRLLGTPRAHQAIQPDTLEVVRRRWQTVRYDHRFDAELPAEQCFAETVLFGARPGEAIEVLYLPTGTDGQDDPNFATHFWVGLQDDDSTRGGMGDARFAGPVRIL